MHEKYMFCGEPISEIFKLTEFEKEKITISLIKVHMEMAGHVVHVVAEAVNY